MATEAAGIGETILLKEKCLIPVGEVYQAPQTVDYLVKSGYVNSNFEGNAGVTAAGESFSELPLIAAEVPDRQTMEHEVVDNIGHRTSDNTRISSMIEQPYLEVGESDKQSSVEENEMNIEKETITPQKHEGREEDNDAESKASNGAAMLEASKGLKEEPSVHNLDTNIGTSTLASQKNEHEHNAVYAETISVEESNGERKCEGVQGEENSPDMAKPIEKDISHDSVEEASTIPVHSAFVEVEDKLDSPSVTLVTDRSNMEEEISNVASTEESQDATDLNATTNEIISPVDQSHVETSSDKTEISKMISETLREDYVKGNPQETMIEELGIKPEADSYIGEKVFAEVATEGKLDSFVKNEDGDKNLHEDASALENRDEDKDAAAVAGEENVEQAVLRNNQEESGTEKDLSSVDLNQKNETTETDKNSGETRFFEQETILVESKEPGHDPNSEPQGQLHEGSGDNHDEKKNEESGSEKISSTDVPHETLEQNFQAGSLHEAATTLKDEEEDDEKTNTRNYEVTSIEKITTNLSSEVINEETVESYLQNDKEIDVSKGENIEEQIIEGTNTACISLEEAPVKNFENKSSSEEEISMTNDKENHTDLPQAETEEHKDILKGIEYLEQIKETEATQADESAEETTKEENITNERCITSAPQEAVDEIPKDENVLSREVKEKIEIAERETPEMKIDELLVTDSFEKELGESTNFETREQVHEGEENSSETISVIDKEITAAGEATDDENIKENFIEISSEVTKKETDESSQQAEKEEDVEKTLQKENIEQTLNVMSLTVEEINGERNSEGVQGEENSSDMAKPIEKGKDEKDISHDSVEEASTIPVHSAYVEVEDKLDSPSVTLVTDRSSTDEEISSVASTEESQDATNLIATANEIISSVDQSHVETSDDDSVKCHTEESGSETISSTDVPHETMERNIQAGSLHEAATTLKDDEKTSTTNDEVTSIGKITDEKIIRANATNLSSEVIDEETVEGNLQIDKEIDVSKGEIIEEQIIEGTNTACISLEAVEEDPVKNFENDENDIDNPGSREILLESEAVEQTPNATIPSSLIKEAESLVFEDKGITEESLPKEKKEEESSVILLEDDNKEIDKKTSEPVHFALEMNQNEENLNSSIQTSVTTETEQALQEESREKTEQSLNNMEEVAVAGPQDDEGDAEKQDVESESNGKRLPLEHVAQDSVKNFTVDNASEKSNTEILEKPKEVESIGNITREIDQNDSPVIITPAAQAEDIESLQYKDKDIAVEAASAEEKKEEPSSIKTSEDSNDSMIEENSKSGDQETYEADDYSTREMTQKEEPSSIKTSEDSNDSITVIEENNKDVDQDTSESHDSYSREDCTGEIEVWEHKKEDAEEILQKVEQDPIKNLKNDGDDADKSNKEIFEQPKEEESIENITDETNHNDSPNTTNTAAPAADVESLQSEAKRSNDEISDTTLQSSTIQEREIPHSENLIASESSSEEEISMTNDKENHTDQPQEETEEHKDILRSVEYLEQLKETEATQADESAEETTKEENITYGRCISSAQQEAVDEDSVILQKSESCIDKSNAEIAGEAIAAETSENIAGEAGECLIGTIPTSLEDTTASNEYFETSTYAEDDTIIENQEQSSDKKDSQEALADDDDIRNEIPKDEVKPKEAENTEKSEAEIEKSEENVNASESKEQVENKDVEMSIQENKGSKEDIQKLETSDDHTEKYHTEEVFNDEKIEQNFQAKETSTTSEGEENRSETISVIDKEVTATDEATAVASTADEAKQTDTIPDSSPQSSLLTANESSQSENQTKCDGSPAEEEIVVDGSLIKETEDKERNSELSESVEHNKQLLNEEIDKQTSETEQALQEESREKTEQSLNNMEEAVVAGPQDDEGDAETEKQDVKSESNDIRLPLEQDSVKNFTDDNASEKSNTEILEQPKAVESIDNITHEIDQNDSPVIITPAAVAEDIESLQYEDKDIAAEEKTEEPSSIKTGEDNNGSITVKEEENLGSDNVTSGEASIKNDEDEEDGYTGLMDSENGEELLEKEEDAEQVLQKDEPTENIEGPVNVKSTETEAEIFSELKETVESPQDNEIQNYDEISNKEVLEEPLKGETGESIALETNQNYEITNTTTPVEEGESLQDESENVNNLEATEQSEAERSHGEENMEPKLQNEPEEYLDSSSDVITQASDIEILDKKVDEVSIPKELPTVQSNEKTEKEEETKGNEDSDGITLNACTNEDTEKHIIMEEHISRDISPETSGEETCLINENKEEIAQIEMHKEFEPPHIADNNTEQVLDKVNIERDQHAEPATVIADEVAVMVPKTEVHEIIEVAAENGDTGEQIMQEGRETEDILEVPGVDAEGLPGKDKGAENYTMESKQEIEDIKTELTEESAKVENLKDKQGSDTDLYHVKASEEGITPNESTELDSVCLESRSKEETLRKVEPCISSGPHTQEEGLVILEKTGTPLDFMSNNAALKEASNLVENKDHDIQTESADRDEDLKFEAVERLILMQILLESEAVETVGNDAKQSNDEILDSTLESSMVQEREILRSENLIASESSSEEQISMTNDKENHTDQPQAETDEEHKDILKSVEYLEQIKETEATQADESAEETTKGENITNGKCISSAPQEAVDEDSVIFQKNESCIDKSNAEAIAAETCENIASETTWNTECLVENIPKSLEDTRASNEYFETDTYFEDDKIIENQERSSDKKDTQEVLADDDDDDYIRNEIPKDEENIKENFIQISSEVTKTEMDESSQQAEKEGDTTAGESTEEKTIFQESIEEEPIENFQSYDKNSENFEESETYETVGSTADEAKQTNTNPDSSPQSSLLTAHESSQSENQTKSDGSPAEESVELSENVERSKELLEEKEDVEQRLQKDNIEDKGIPEESIPEEKTVERSSIILLEDDNKEIHEQTSEPVHFSLEMNQNEESRNSSIIQTTVGKETEQALQEESRETIEQSLNNMEDAVAGPQDDEGDAETAKQDVVSESNNIRLPLQQDSVKNFTDNNASEKSNTEILEQPKAVESINNVTHEIDPNDSPIIMTPAAQAEDIESLQYEDKDIAVEASAEVKKEEPSSGEASIKNDEHEDSYTGLMDAENGEELLEKEEDAEQILQKDEPIENIEGPVNVKSTETEAETLSELKQTVESPQDNEIQNDEISNKEVLEEPSKGETGESIALETNQNYQITNTTTPVEEGESLQDESENVNNLEEPSLEAAEKEDDDCNFELTQATEQSEAERSPMEPKLQNEPEEYLDSSSDVITQASDIEIFDKKADEISNPEELPTVQSNLNGEHFQEDNTACTNEDTEKHIIMEEHLSRDISPEPAGEETYLINENKEEIAQIEMHKEFEPPHIADDNTEQVLDKVNIERDQHAEPTIVNADEVAIMAPKTEVHEIIEVAVENSDTGEQTVQEGRETEDILELPGVDAEGLSGKDEDDENYTIESKQEEGLVMVETTGTPLDCRSNNSAVEEEASHLVENKDHEIQTEVAARDEDLKFEIQDKTLIEGSNNIDETVSHKIPSDNLKENSLFPSNDSELMNGEESKPTDDNSEKDPSIHENLDNEHISQVTGLADEDIRNVRENDVAGSYNSQDLSQDIELERYQVDQQEICKSETSKDEESSNIEDEASKCTELTNVDKEEAILDKGGFSNKSEASLTEKDEAEKATDENVAGNINQVVVTAKTKNSGVQAEKVYTVENEGDETLQSEKSEEQYQTEPFVLLSKELELGSSTEIKKLEDTVKEEELQEDEQRKSEEACLQKEDSSELQVSEPDFEPKKDAEESSYGAQKEESATSIKEEIENEKEASESDLDSKEEEEITPVRTNYMDRFQEENLMPSDPLLSTEQEGEASIIIGSTEEKTKEMQPLEDEPKAIQDTCIPKEEPRELTAPSYEFQPHMDEQVSESELKSGCQGCTVVSEEPSEFKPSELESQTIEETPRAQAKQNQVELTMETSHQRDGVAACLAEANEIIHQQEKTSDNTLKDQISVKKEQETMASIAKKEAVEVQHQEPTKINEFIDTETEGGEKAESDEKGNKAIGETVATDSATISLQEMLKRSAREKQESEGGEKVKSDEEEEDEEEGEQKKDESGSDGPVIVESTRDMIEVKNVQKKSHNILSGVGSKVKHSIIKVKKAITGKSSSSHTKQQQQNHSPK